MNHLAVPSIPSTATVYPPTIAMRTYLSTHHLWAASHFAILAESLEAQHQGASVFSIRHRTYVMSGVQAAVNFLEAAINELFEDIADAHPSYTAALDEKTRSALNAYWKKVSGRGPVLKKYQAALRSASRDQLNPEGEPYQGVALLIRLRDRLVHFSPETVGIDDERWLEQQLRTRFLPNAMITSAGNPYFPDKCLGAGCARWAVTAARALTDEAFDRLGVEPNHHRVAWSDDGAP